MRQITDSILQYLAILVSERLIFPSEMGQIADSILQCLEIPVNEILFSHWKWGKSLIQFYNF